MSCLLQIRLMPKLLPGKLLRSSPGDKTSILQRFGSLHRRFLNSLVWPEAAGLASVDVGTSTLEGCRWCLCLGGSHDGSMGRTVYLPTFWLMFMVDVGRSDIPYMDPMVFFATKNKSEGEKCVKLISFIVLYQLEICNCIIFYKFS